MSLRIVKFDLDTDELTLRLEISPEYSMKPGESQVHHGGVASAGYWCGSLRVDYPERPTVLFDWLERIAFAHEAYLRELLNEGADINAYLGIHANVMTVGFKLPFTPTLWKLEIPIGIEFFGR